MALELRNRLEAALGITLPVPLVWAYPTITALAGALCERMGYEPIVDTRLQKVAAGFVRGDVGKLERLPGQPLEPARHLLVGECLRPGDVIDFGIVAVGR